jgi:hypothetical protein
LFKDALQQYQKSKVSPPVNPEGQEQRFSCNFKGEPEIHSHSKSNSEFFMQEIISPFRNKNELVVEESPECSPNKVLDVWTINPMQIPRINLYQENNEEMPMESEENQTTIYDGTQSSICQSPVKNPLFFKSVEADVVSTGKLKKFI